MAAGTYVVDDLARFVLAADPTDMPEDAPMLMRRDILDSLGCAIAALVEHGSKVGSRRRCGLEVLQGRDRQHRQLVSVVHVHEGLVDVGAHCPSSVDSAAQRQVIANRAPGFLRDYVAELSEGEQVCPRRQLAIGVRVVESHAPAPHTGPARISEATGKVDPDVLARRRLVTTSQVDTMGAPRPSTRDVAAETGRACSIRRRRTRQDPRFPDAGSTHYASFLERHFGLPEEH